MLIFWFFSFQRTWTNTDEEYEVSAASVSVYVSNVGDKQAFSPIIQIYHKTFQYLAQWHFRMRNGEEWDGTANPLVRATRSPPEPR